MSPADMYIIMNNFLLNSAYFLEREQNPQRNQYQAISEADLYHLEPWNNGPKLSENMLLYQSVYLSWGKAAKKK